jgi:hypothetical protein
MAKPVTADRLIDDLSAVIHDAEGLLTGRANR